MKQIRTSFNSMLASVPGNIRAEVDLSFAISNRIDELIHKRGMTKKEFADAIKCRPSEVTKWLSGQHNFTLRTLARIESFFGEPIVNVAQ